MIHLFVENFFFKLAKRKKKKIERSKKRAGTKEEKRGKIEKQK